MTRPPDPGGDAVLLLVLDDGAGRREWALRLRALVAAEPNLRILAAPRFALPIPEVVGLHVGLYASIHEPGERPLGEPRTPVRVAGDGRWIETACGRVDLTRKRSARSILRELVAVRQRAPGVALGTEALFAVGWPGQRVRSESVAGRVYTAIWALRSAGLGDALLRTPDGYLLDPAADLIIDLKQSPECGRPETGGPRRDV